MIGKVVSFIVLSSCVLFFLNQHRDITTQTPCTLVEKLDMECWDENKFGCYKVKNCVQYVNSSIGTKVAIYCGSKDCENYVGSTGYCQSTPCNQNYKVNQRYSPVAPGPGYYGYCKHMKRGFLYDEFVSIWYDYISYFIIAIFAYICYHSDPPNSGDSV